MSLSLRSRGATTRGRDPPFRREGRDREQREHRGADEPGGNDENWRRPGAKKEESSRSRPKQ